MTTPSKSVNAWIFPAEDEPADTTYKSPNSSYQSLIKYGVYNCTDMVNICFVTTVKTDPLTVPPGNGSSYTIQLQPKVHTPGPITNQQYMDWIIQDARQANPKIKVLVTLSYNDNVITRIFSNDKTQWPQDAKNFASNLMAYLKHYNLDGFDVDWEPGVSEEGTPEQFNILFTAIRTAFNAESRYYYLTLSPSEVGTLDPNTVNSAFDFVNLQLYGGASPGEFTGAGVEQNLLAYGAKFEVDGDVPYEDAQRAYYGYTTGGYNVITQWRLNSNDFQFEQAQQMILYQLVYRPLGPSFDDTPIVGAAGNPPILELTIRSGDVLDAVQVTNIGTFEKFPVRYILLQHGGNGGTSVTVPLPPGDQVVEVSGYTGIWYGHKCVLQITLKTQSGKTFGPYGTMAGATTKVPFTYTAPADQSLRAFSGTIVPVPLAGGGLTDIIASLQASFG
jgi:hypothetical protein